MANEERRYDSCFGVWDCHWEGCDVVSYGVWVCCMSKGGLLYYGTKGIVTLSSKKDWFPVSTLNTAIDFVHPFAFCEIAIFSDLRVHSLGNALVCFASPIIHPLPAYTFFRLHQVRRLAHVLAWSSNCLVLHVLNLTFAWLYTYSSLLRR